MQRTGNPVAHRVQRGSRKGTRPEDQACNGQRKLNKAGTLSREVKEVTREARAHAQSRQVAGLWSRLKSTYQGERSLPVEDR